MGRVLPRLLYVIAAGQTKLASGRASQAVPAVKMCADVLLGNAAGTKFSFESVGADEVGARGVFAASLAMVDGAFVTEAISDVVCMTKTAQSVKIIIVMQSYLNTSAGGRCWRRSRSLLHEQDQ
jgi:hypothetical protein